MTDPDSSAQTLVEHLLELRTRLIRLLLGIGICLALTLPFAKEIYSFIAEPLISVLPQGSSMIATSPVAPFFVPLKVALMSAFLLSLPNSAYQIWAFIAPGLYQNEKKLIIPLILSTIVLFFTGMAFAYFFVFPTVFHFMAKVTPDGVNMATDIDQYLSFILGMFVAFGVTFEVPVVVLILNRMNIISIAKLKSIRPYVIVGAFIVAAIITPPDVLSQILLAIPLIILYEFGIFLCRFIQKNKTNTAPTESDENEE